MTSLFRKPARDATLDDYLIRSASLYARDAGLRQQFGSPEDSSFRRFVDTEAILYVKELQEAGVPFPSSEEMLAVGGETDLRVFLTIGYDCYESVRQLIPTGLGRLPRLLDFGIGCARTTRFFYRDARQLECHGCDVDRRAVDYLRRSVQFVRSRVTGNLPPLPYEDRFFDLVYSISVFAHLDLESTKLWLGEMHRVLADDGVLAISLHGQRAFETIVREPSRRKLIGIDEAEFSSAMKLFEAEGFVWFRQPVASSDVDRSRFGISFVSPACLERLSAPLFRVRDHAQGTLQGWQDLAVLERAS